MYTLEPCEEPLPSTLHSGLDWDNDNLLHINDLTREQIENGLMRGYFSLGPNPNPMYEDQCQFLFLFQPMPPWMPSSPKDPIYTLVIETSRGTLRPITVWETTKQSHVKAFLDARRKGELE